MPFSDSELAFIKKVKFKPKHTVKQVLMPQNVPLFELEALKPYENNAKIHTPTQVSKICHSIDKSKRWTQPIIVDGEGVIIAGHGRRLAAGVWGLSKVPVIKLEGISEEDAMLLRLADNKVAEGEIDTNALEAELKILAEFNVDMFGIYEERELEFLTDDLGEIDFGQITQDISKDVERQLCENEKIVDEIEDKNQRLASIFGKRSINHIEARILSRFLAYIEEEQGEEGIDALVSFAEIYLEGKE